MKRAVWAKKGLRQLGSETQPGITCHALGPWSLLFSSQHIQSPEHKS